MITLHHFSEPFWFHNKGSFEHEGNIAFFVEFCKKICKELMQDYKGKPLVEYFCTINEPAIEAYSRYLSGYFPPNLTFRFIRGARFLFHMLKAHSKVYESCKAIASSLDAKVQIGITHQYLCFYPHHYLMRPLVCVHNKYQEAVLRYFKTGVFSCKIPFFSFVKETPIPKTDFVGVQFYARVYLGLKGVFSRGRPITTMLGVYEDPEGLYEAIINIYEAFRVPIVVTESGISTLSDEQRARFLTRALSSASHAADKIGRENLIGFIVWSFTDNYEWFLGWKPKFGTYSFCPEKGLSDQYKSGVQPFVDALKTWKESL
jgi:beta-glucosidase